MRDQSAAADRAERMGASEDETTRIAPYRPPDEPPEPMGLGGLARYGLQTGMEQALTGAGRVADDWLGAESLGDAADRAAEWVAPTKEQGERAAELYDQGGHAADVGHAVVQEAPMVLGTIGAGAAAGAAFGAPGRAIGALIGAGQGVLRLYDQGAQQIEDHYRKQLAQERGVLPDEVPTEDVQALVTDSDRQDMLLASSVGMLDALPVARVLSKLPLGKELVRKAAARQVRNRSVLAAGGKELGVVGALQGGQEIAENIALDLLTNRELQEQVRALPQQDMMSVLEFLADVRGVDMAKDFAAGALLGAPLGAGAGAAGQAATNKLVGDRAQTLIGVARKRGVEPEAIEEAAKGDKAGEVVKAGEDLDRARVFLDQGEAMLQQAKAQDAPKETTDALEELVSQRRANYAQLSDDVGDRLGIKGWRSAKDVEKLDSQFDDAQRADVTERLRGFGITADRSADTATLQRNEQAVAEAESEVEGLEARVDAIGDKDRRAKASDDLASAKRRLYDARVTALEQAGGLTTTQAVSEIRKLERRDFQRGKREEAVRRQAEAEFPDDMAPEAQVARAKEIVEEHEAKPPSAAEKGLNRKIERLTNARRSETDPAKIANITDEIADLEARRGLPAPAVEAARRVLQAQGEAIPGQEGEASRPEPQAEPAKARDIVEPATQESVASDVEATLARADAKPEATGDAGPKRKPRKAGSPALRGLLMPEDGAERTLVKNRDLIPLVEAAERAQTSDSAMALFATDLRRRRLIDDEAAAPEMAERIIEADAQDQLRADEIAEGAADIPPDAPRRQGYGLGDQNPWEDLTNEIGAAPTEAELHERMLDWTRESRREAAAHVAADGALLGVGTVRLRNGVMPPREGFGDPTVTFVHTHTAQTPLSVGDVRAMLEHGGSFRALLPDGSITEMRPAAAARKSDVSALNSDVLIAADGVMPLEMNLVERDVIRQEAVLRHLQDNGVIEYTQPFELSREQQEMVDEIVEATRETAAARLGPDSDGRRAAEADDRRWGRTGAERTGLPDAPTNPEARGATREQTLVDPERIEQLTDDVWNYLRPDLNPETGKRARAGRPPTGDSNITKLGLTRDTVRNGVAVAARSLGNKSGYIIRDMLDAMYPGFLQDPSVLGRPKTGGVYDRGKPVLQITGAENTARANSAASILLAMSKVDHGFIYPEMRYVKRNRGQFRFLGQHLMGSSEMKDFLDFAGMKDDKLLPAIDNPDDTQGVARKPRSSRMTPEQLAPAERTARYFQRNQYTIDKRALAALTPLDLISDKGLAGKGLSKDMIPTLEAIEKRLDNMTGEPATRFQKLSKSDREFMTEQGIPLRDQISQATHKLERFRRAVAQFDKDYPGRKIGFRYQVDDKGRIYAEGEMHPQTSDEVKGVFVHDGESLADMHTMDNSASGWQVAALMARDEVLAPQINLGKDQATEPGAHKRDMYNSVIAGVYERIRAAAADPKSPKNSIAKLALKTVVEPDVIKRAMVKPPVIAVNYAGGVDNFRSHFNFALRGAFTAAARPGKAQKARDSERTKVANYIGTLGMEALRAAAPRTMAMQDWALDTIQKTSAAVESNDRNARALSEWTVGANATFATKKMAMQDVSLTARTTEGGGALEFETMNARPNDIRLVKDAKGDPIQLPQRKGRAKELTFTDTAPVAMDKLDAEATARSVYSQIIQGFDASVLHRAVERYKGATDGAFLTTNHDAYTIPRGTAPQMGAAARESLYQILNDAGNVPQRIYDDATRNLAKVNLTPEDVGITPPPERGTYDMSDVLTSTPLFSDYTEGRTKVENAVPTYAELEPRELPLARDLRRFDPLPEPELAMARDVDVAGYMEQFPEAANTLGKVRATVLDPAASSVSYAQALEDNVLNGFAPIRRLEIAVKGELPPGMDSAFKASEIAVNDSGRNESLLYYGAAAFDKNGGFSTAPGTVGLHDIFRMAGGEGAERGQRLQHWMEYMVARRAKDLGARAFKTPLSQKDISDALARETPEFKAAADAWKKYNDANLDFLEQSGRINKAQKDAMQADEFYVPFYRTDQRVDGTSPDLQIIEYKGAGGRGKQVLARDPGIMGLKGGDKMRIANLMQNMIRNSQAMTAAAMRNVAANKSFELMESAGLARTEPITSSKPDLNAIHMWRNGVESWLIPEGEEAAPYVLALAGLQPQQMSAIGRLGADIASFFRQSITLTPAFMLRNWIRGAVSTGLLTSGSNLALTSNSLTGFREAYRNSDATRAFKAQSGMGDYRFGTQDIGFGKNDILIDFGMRPKTIGHTLRRGLSWGERVGTATELGDRVAAYKTMIKNGVRQDEAAYQALTIMNYGRRGGSQALRAWLPLVPFLNARLQGYVRLAEGAVGRKGAAKTRGQALRKMALNGGLLALASTALHGWVMSDEEDRERYAEEPLWRKLNYHVFYAGETRISIPKAFELGYIFSSIPEVLFDKAFYGIGEPDKALVKMITDTLMFSAVPHAVKPISEVLNNYDTFTQRPIEGRRDERVVPELRTSGSSPLATAIGQAGLTQMSQVVANLTGLDALELSPSKIEHLLDGYGGIAYGMLSTGFTIAAAEMGYAPKSADVTFGEIPVVSNAARAAAGWMVNDAGLGTAEAVELYYDATTHIQQVYTSARGQADNGDMERVEELIKELGPAGAAGLQALRDRANKSRDAMGELNSSIRTIEQNTELTGKRKNQLLKPLKQARNRLARDEYDIIVAFETKTGVQIRDLR